jgi:hypothetical protein
VGGGDFGESSVDSAFGLTIDDVLIISCDRYSPWNGTDTGRPDHVWADLPGRVGARMLVYSEHEAQVSPDAYCFGSVEFVRSQLSARDRTGVVLETACDLWRALTIDRRLALGFHPMYVARYLWRWMRRRPLSPHLARMQVARRVLLHELRRRSPKVALFHGEFDNWGIAVAQACRDAGVVPVAVQHGPISRSNEQYSNLTRIEPFIASALLCVSESEFEKWDDLSIPVGLLGSRRVRWNLPDPGSADDRGVKRLEDRLLIVPPSMDSEKFRTAVLSHPELPVDVKPHPLHRDNWVADHVRVVDGELNGLLPRYDVVITGSPNAQIALAMLDQPYIRIRSSDSADWESESGGVAFDSLDEVLSRAAERNWLISVRARHVPTGHIPPDVSTESLLSAVTRALA